MVVGIALSIGAARQQDVNNRNQIQAAASETGEQITREIVSAIQLHQYGLRGARGAALSVGADGLSREAFKRYTESRDLGSEFPGALGIGLVRRIHQSDEPNFEVRARRDGWPDFAVRQLERHDGDRYVIQYIEPVEQNRAAVGLDIASEASRRMAAEASMRSGKATLTAPITLVQGPEKGSQSFLLLLPIYQSPKTPASEDERVNSTIGWSFAPLTMTNVFANISVDRSAIVLKVSDVTNPAAETKFYQIGNDDPSIVASVIVNREVFGRRWQVSLGVLPPFVTHLNQFPARYVLWTGLFASLLMATAVALLNMSRQRQWHIVSEQARLATIVDNSSDPIIGEALDGRILSWNAAAERMFGYSETEARGRLLADILISPKQRNEDKELLARIGRGEAVEAFETVRIAKDGTPIDVSVATSSLRDSSSAIIGVAEILRDLRGHRAEQRRQIEFSKNLERQVAERTTELKSVNTMLEGVLHAASEVAIIATDVDGTIRLFNEGAERMLGYSADEVVGKQSPAIFHVGEEVEKRGRQLSAAFGKQISRFQVFVHILEGDGSEIREWTYIRKDGSRLDVSLVVTGMRDDSGKISGYLGIAVDITERKRTMKELATAKIAADSANKAKSQFLAMMSHELRTPMAGVLGMADLLMDSALTEDQQKLLCGQIKSANTLLDLLNDILDFAKIESGRIELENFDFDLGGTVGDVAETVAPLASERGNTVQMDVTPELNRAFFGDGKRYRQVLMNLVGNASKFTTSGRVTIKIAQKQLDADSFEITTTVSDTGIGISPEGLQLLFQPFTQEDASTSRKFGGTGLGLAISKQLVELMGGRIWADSEKGVGSSFAFTVPLKMGNSAIIESATTGHHRASLGGLALPVTNRPLKLLLAEDSDTNRMLLVTLLSRMGHEVKAVENGALAVEEAARGNFDIILMDMQMPVMDGPAAVKIIREMTGSVAGIPIIALTADALSENQKRYIAQGVNRVVTKPVDWRQLNAEMEKLTATLGGSMVNLDTSALNVETPSRLNEVVPVLDDEFLGSLANAVGLETFAPMIDSFIISISNHGEELRKKSDDIVLAKKAAHGLKGVAIQFGALRLGELARQIEEDAQTADEIRIKLPQIEGLIGETAGHMRAWRARRKT